jgi:hypothetical protein
MASEVLRSLGWVMAAPMLHEGDGGQQNVQVLFSGISLAAPKNSLI